MRNPFNNIKYIVVGISAFIALCVHVDAASISLVPSATNVSEGNIVSVSIVTNTEGAAINNAEASIQYPTDLLDVVSISKNNSIFTLWVEEPQFSNSTGRATFNGGAANPGYNGAKGSIATITFRAKHQGTASVLLSDAAVRANDGLGTNILTSTHNATITVGGSVPAPAQPTIPTPPHTGVPGTPTIVSETHPKQDAWYATNTASFGWNVPTGVIKIQAQANKTAGGIPSTTYDNSVSQKTFSNLSDGTYYLHVRYANATGWGSTTQYRFNVDTTAPLAFTPSVRTVGTQQYLLLNAEDTTSGIEYYTIEIDRALVVRVANAVLIASEYTLPVLAEGAHTVIVTAYDKAGNHTSTTLSLVSPTIVPPVLAIATPDIQKGESVTITGTTKYPNTTVDVVLQSKGKQVQHYTQTTATDGTFSLTTDKLNSTGVIAISAVLVLSEKVQSAPSEKVYVAVHQTQIASITLTILWIGVCIALALILIVLAWIGWHKFLSLRKVQKKKLGEIAEDAHRAITLLKQELHGQLAELEEVEKNRALNKEEERIFKDIQKNINDVDAFLEKKLTKLM